MNSISVVTTMMTATATTAHATGTTIASAVSGEEKYQKHVWLQCIVYGDFAFHVALTYMCSIYSESDIIYCGITH